MASNRSARVHRTGVVRARFAHLNVFAAVLHACMTIIVPGCSQVDDTLDLERTELELEQTQAATSSVSQASEDETVVRYEAESYTSQRDSKPALNQPDCSGGGFVDFGGQGSWIEWNNVNAATESVHRLSLRYANGTAAARPAAVIVNGRPAGTLQFSTTGKWTSWQTVSLLTPLRQGSNTIRVEASTTTGGPNVDYLETAPDPSMTLPLEVLGPAGTQASVQVRIDDPTQVTHLYIRCNACGYHDQARDADPTQTKATVRVNGGAPIALKHFKNGPNLFGDPNIEVIGAEGDYGGIGGAFRTVRMKVPVTGLVAGLNTITFEHSVPAPPSIGFRILELNFLRGGSLFDRVLTSRHFEQDDPTKWKAPSGTASDIQAGELLWRKRNSLYDPGVDALDGVMNRGGALTGAIIASCADCHASDGRDLAYFNFSNHSIVARSIFHGLSREDGTRIASYVRSRGLPVVRAARPWNPTYQPGPGLDSRPVYEWAAGAGLDAILDSDAELEPYLFPEGTSLAAVRKVVDRYDTLNLRELPLSLPMPEWNQWLPLIHPDDAFRIQASAAVRADETGADVGAPYYRVLYEAARANPTPASIGAMTERVKAWLRRDMTCISNGPGNGEPWRGLNGAVLSSLKLPTPKKFTAANCNDVRTRAEVEPFEIAKRALSAWLSVKQWEIVHGNNLESEGSKLTTPVCSRGRCVDASEPRGWNVEGRNVFDRAPHFIGHLSLRYYSQTRVVGAMETNSWYHLNMILNPGYRRTMPSHFAYTYSQVEVLQEESGIDQGFRFWATMIKQRQLQTTGRYGVEEGLDLRTAQPYIYYSSFKANTAAQGSVGRPIWRSVVQALLEDFLADVAGATAQDWENATDNSKVQPRNSTDFSLCDSCFEPSSTTPPFGLLTLQGRNTYRVIPKLRELGIGPYVLSSLIDWGKKTWPNGAWDTLR